MLSAGDVLLGAVTTRSSRAGDVRLQGNLGNRESGFGSSILD